MSGRKAKARAKQLALERARRAPTPWKRLGSGRVDFSRVGQVDVWALPRPTAAQVAAIALGGVHGT